MGTLLQDVRYGLRMLLKNPGFTVVAVLTLALGIGANSTLFSVVNSVLLRPLPFPNPGRLVAVWEFVPEKGWYREPFSFPDFADWREQTKSFEKMAAYTYVGATLGEGGDAEFVGGAAVSADLFPILSARPRLGRVFTAEEDRPGAARAVILGHGLWERRFHSSPEVLGQTILLDGESCTVVGVMPETFNFPIGGSPRSYWVPLTTDPDTRERVELRGNHYLRAVGLLKEGIGPLQAEADLDTIARRLETAYPGTNHLMRARVLPLHEELVGDVRPALLVLLGAVGFVLLIACANIANLLLARASSRQKEIAIRAALGAGWGRIARQLLVESLLLSLAGGALGLLVAIWGVDFVVRLAPGPIPRIGEIGLDVRVLAFTLGVSLLTGILSGLAPALRSARASLDPDLREGRGGEAEGWRRNRVRALLVVSEVALSLVLLAGAGLMLRTFQRLSGVDPGFKPENVLTVSVSLPNASYPNGAQRIAFVDRLLERVGAVPGVRSAATVFTLPLGGSNRSNSFRIPDRPQAPEGDPDANYRTISPGYLVSMGIPLLKGRAFTAQDGATTPAVALVNETFARRFFPGEDPIGKVIETDEDGTRRREIVGVVGDVRFDSLDSHLEPEYYVPYPQAPETSVTLVVRAAKDPSSLAPTLREQVRALDPSLPLYAVRTMEEYLAASVADRRVIALLLGSFAAVALALAATGLYGVLAYSVSRRTREIGIRVALGARPADVLKLVVAQGMLLTVAGLGIGLAGGLLLTRFLSGLLFGVRPTDPLTFAGVSALLAGVALLACYLPARRAARVDPVTALHYE
ncbi:MAG: ABC transporter permease [Acidobacteria bacterium]|nr:ABC transporter permease [Acidobacteriota bacterium]MCI0567430.1 ABC transporter permease [Acidobacteriota bacterium]